MTTAVDIHNMTYASLSKILQWFLKDKASSLIRATKAFIKNVSLSIMFHLTLLYLILARHNFFLGLSFAQADLLVTCSIYPTTKLVSSYPLAICPTIP
jgi:hypothetical protein